VEKLRKKLSQHCDNYYENKVSFWKEQVLLREDYLKDLYPELSDLIDEEGKRMWDHITNRKDPESIVSRVEE
jgi:hypothetical protein